MIPQFDILTLGAQVFGLFFNLTLLYYFNIKILVPKFAGVKKFRTKKLTNNYNEIKIINNSTNNISLNTTNLLKESYLSQN